MAKMGLNLAVRDACCQILELLLASAVRIIYMRLKLSSNQRFGTYANASEISLA